MNPADEKGDRRALPERPEGCSAQSATCPLFVRRELCDLLGQLREGQLDQSGLARLDALVSGDAAARRLYLEYVDLCASLHWAAVERNEGSGVRGQGSESPNPKSQIPNRQILHHPSDVANPEPLIPPIVIDTSSTIHYPLFAIHSSLGGWLVSYAAATVLTGAAILGAWLYKVSHDYPAAEPSRPSVAAVAQQANQAEPKLEMVGTITGTAGCQWANPQDAPSRSAIPLGGKYALASGLLEISYNTGAKVILQGPCVYEIDSATGGFLSLGKLTARVEQGSGVSGQGSDSSNPKSQISNPKFVVKTPTAVVTDLGTEFGVEVDKSGASRPHVFRGRVELRSANVDKEDGGHIHVITLGENESATVRVRQDHVVAMTREPGEPGKFARGMPKRAAIELSDTGMGLKEGDADPHWQLVARSDDPRFKPRPAIVTAVPNSTWLPNDCRPSKWISTGKNAPDLPDDVTYTFRTTFELTGMVPGTAVLKGWFMADNRVTAIRLNGTQAAVPEHVGHGPYDRFHEFATRTGFVEGANSLELDVYNGDPDDPHPSSPMALRVELEGSVLSGFKTALPQQQRPREKEGTPMNR